MRGTITGTMMIFNDVYLEYKKRYDKWEFSLYIVINELKDRYIFRTPVITEVFPREINDSILERLLNEVSIVVENGFIYFSWNGSCNSIVWPANTNGEDSIDIKINHMNIYNTITVYCAPEDNRKAYKCYFRYPAEWRSVPATKLPY